MLLLTAILILTNGASGHLEDRYKAFNVWAEDEYALNLLGVKTSSSLSRIQCCAVCSRDSSCFGVAWNRETNECQAASLPDAVAFVDLKAVTNWSFMVNEQFVCGSE
ncbi:hypothetical protein CAPTEDRAFT_201262, partial [Capitella teleta]